MKYTVVSNAVVVGELEAAIRYRGPLAPMTA